MKGPLHSHRLSGGSSVCSVKICIYKNALGLQYLQRMLLVSRSAVQDFHCLNNDADLYHRNLQVIDCVHCNLDLKLLLIKFQMK